MYHVLIRSEKKHFFYIISSPDNYAARMFEYLDDNKDGVVGFSEWFTNYRNDDLNGNHHYHNFNFNFKILGLNYTLINLIELLYLLLIIILPARVLFNVVTEAPVSEI